MAGTSAADFLIVQRCKATVVEMAEEFGKDLVDKAVFMKTMDREGFKILTGTKVERFTKDGAVCAASDGEITISGCDLVILAIGSTAYNPLEKELEGRVPELYVIGDAKEARRIKDAVREAAELAVRI